MYRALPLFLILTLHCLGGIGHPARILHHDLEANVDPLRQSIAVVDVLTVAVDAQTQSQPFGFFLNRHLELLEVSVADGKRRVTVQEVPHPEALQDLLPAAHAGDIPDRSVAKYYRVLPAGSETLGDHPLQLRVVYRGMLIDPRKPPLPAQTYAFTGAMGHIEPRGTYLMGATVWIPHRPGELFSFTLRTVFPEGYVSVSQGKRSAQGVTDGVVRTEWQCPFPQQQIYLIAGRYTVTEEQHGEVAVMTFLYTADPQLNRSYIAATKRYLDLYSRLIGPYPYKKFALVENYWQTGLGMPSFTLLGDRVIRLPFIVSTSYGHEILHNWWGNSVYVDWQSGNWSEGLTTYGADYLYQEMQSPDAAREYRRGLLQDYLNYVHSPHELPLRAFQTQDSRASRAVGYGKAAMVFHMLRRMVGDGDYWAALRKFYADYRFRVASWEDVLSTFETITKRDFSPFKVQWIDQAGAPLVSLHDALVRHPHTPYLLELEIGQSPPYHLEIPVHIDTERGGLRRIVSLQDAVQRLVFTLDAKPLQVHVDPDFDVFRKLHRAEVPPTIGQALGAEAALIVLPGAGDPSMMQAYDSLARQWAADPKYTVVRDVDYTAVQGKHRAIWLFGEAAVGAFWTHKLPKAVRIAADQWLIAGAAYDPGEHALVLTMAHPENPDLTIALLRSANPEHVLTIGRKIRHYGKSSYVVFAADKALNSGVWPVTTSPMRREVRWE